MSHIATYTASLGNVNQDLLKQILESVAQKFKGTVTTSIKDYYGKTLTEWKGASIIAGIQTPRVTRGLGLAIVGGKLQFIGDTMGCESEFKAISNEIELTYKKVALIQALGASGYEVEVAETTTGTVIQGVRA